MKKISILFIFIILTLCLLTFSACANVEDEGDDTPILKVFENITFEGIEVFEDGESHSLFVKNLPEFATVTYQGNGQTTPGVYTVTASIVAEGYQPLTLTATLKIKALGVFENITFENSEVIYDGNAHSIEVVGAPEFATVTYQGNNQTEAGVYTITATIEAENYSPLILTAVLKITLPKKDFENITFEDKKVAYDGNTHSIEISGDLPEGATVTYKAVDESGKENSFSEIGEYPVEAKIECENYNPLTLYATLTIYQAPILSIEEEKESLKIDGTLKYDDLFDALMKHNFTLTLQLGTKQTYPDGEITYSEFDYFTYGVTENTFYAYYDYATKYLDDYMEFATIVGDDVLVSSVIVKTGKITYRKVPAPAFFETFGGKLISAPFVHLGETEEGGFTPVEVPLYKTAYSNFQIKEGEFSFDTYNFYFHEEYTNSEIEIYTYSNIGNTKITIPKEYMPKQEDANTYEFGEFTLDGVLYNCYYGTWRALIDLSFYDVVLIPPQEIFLLPSIYGVKVWEIAMPGRIYNKNFTGYRYLVYFNQNLRYQDEYSDLGSVDSTSTVAIQIFEDNGGIVNYYSEWKPFID